MKKAFYICLKIVKRIGLQTVFSGLTAYLTYNKTGGGLIATTAVWFAFFALMECVYHGTQTFKEF